MSLTSTSAKVAVTMETLCWRVKRGERSLLPSSELWLLATVVSKWFSLPVAQLLCCSGFLTTAVCVNWKYNLYVRNIMEILFHYPLQAIVLGRCWRRMENTDLEPQRQKAVVFLKKWRQHWSRKSFPVNAWTKLWLLDLFSVDSIILEKKDWTHYQRGAEAHCARLEGWLERGHLIWFNYHLLFILCVLLKTGAPHVCWNWHSVPFRMAVSVMTQGTAAGTKTGSVGFGKRL